MKPLISIIVPVYDVEDYVLKCLESLGGQQYENIEIIIVDDGSTDKSGEICDEFAKNEKRARVFHKKNGGLSSARNYGLKKSKGEIIAFVDSDDYVKSKFISDLYNMMEAKAADISICGYNDVIPKQEVLSGEEAAVRLLTKQENIDIVSWNKLYKKRIFEDNNIFFPEGDKYEDTLTTYKLLSKTKKIAYVDEPLYVYVERKGSIMADGKVEERLSMRERAACEAVKYFKGGDLKAAAEIAMLTAQLAWMDFAIRGKVEKKHFSEGMRWVKQNRKKLLKNKYLSQKLKTYIYLAMSWGGRLYILFRKVRHE